MGVRKEGQLGEGPAGGCVHICGRCPGTSAQAGVWEPGPWFWC